MNADEQIRMHPSLRTLRKFDKTNPISPNPPVFNTSFLEIEPFAVPGVIQYAVTTRRASFPLKIREHPLAA